MTVLKALHRTIHKFKQSGIVNARLQAELLLAFSMGLRKEELYLRLYDPMEKEAEERLNILVKRRIAGEPLQYILGHQEFWSIDLQVDDRVLIPRPETEHLVEEALSILTKISSQKVPSVLELGTGSGAVAIALAKELPALYVTATDLSREALEVAKKNAVQAGVSHQIWFVRGDLLSPFRQGEVFDLILSNPPYLSEEEIAGLAREVRDYEPTVALQGGKDGLEFYRRMIPHLPSYLVRGGWLLLEVGNTQAERISEMIERVGSFGKPERVKDLSGIERVVKAQYQASSMTEYGGSHSPLLIKSMGHGRKGVDGACGMGNRHVQEE